MEQYLKLASKILKEGIKKNDRTKTGTISIFGTQTRYNLNDGFPIVTTKKIFFNAIIHELLWFLKGDTNIRYLIENNVNIWNEWPYQKFKKSKDYNGQTMSEFIELIKSDDNFSKKYGDLGPIYGKQWRNFNGIDQIEELMKMIDENPDSRRLIVSAWNPGEIKEMLLPPCHSFFQFYVNDNKISCQLYQRSADYFLGVPFNIASYSLLCLMISHVKNFNLGDFIHTIGDCHIYDNHIESIKIQLSRDPYKKPFLIINRKVNSIYDFKFEDFTLIDYIHHPSIKGKVAV